MDLGLEPLIHTIYPSTVIRNTNITFLTYKNYEKQIIKIKLAFFLLSLTEIFLQLCKHLCKTFSKASYR